LYEGGGGVKVHVNPWLLWLWGLLQYSADLLYSYVYGIRHIDIIERITVTIGIFVSDVCFLLHFNNVQNTVKMPRSTMKQIGILLIMTGELVTGLENGLARTPPMGWLAWERFRLVKVILAIAWERFRLVKVILAIAWERFRLDKVSPASLGKIQLGKVSLASFGEVEVWQGVPS
jgi:hypothetical protein